MSTNSNTPFSPSLELLIDYVEGLTSAESSARIASYLKTNEEAQAVVDGIAFFFEENGHDRNALEQWLTDAGIKAQPQAEFPEQTAPADETVQEDNVVPLKPSKKRISTRWLMAASIAALIGLGTLSTLVGSKSTHTLVSEQLETPYKVADTWRDAKKSEWNELVQLYDSGHYATFIRECTAYLEQPDPAPAAPLMLGLAHMYRNNFAAATPYLEQAASIENRLQPAAQWYLALNYVRIKKEAEAKPLLEALSSQPASGNQEAARELLEAL